MRTGSFSSFQCLVPSFEDNRPLVKVYYIGLNAGMQIQDPHLLRGKIKRPEMTDTFYLS